MATVPSILWGGPVGSPTYANTLNVGWLLDNARSYPRPYGYAWARGGGHVEDSWGSVIDQILEGDINDIPPSNITAPVTQTGWDGASGVRAFLEWCWNGGIPRWVPDAATPGTYKAVYLEEPRNEAQITPNADGTRDVHVKFRSADGSAFTGYPG